MVAAAIGGAAVIGGVTSVISGNKAAKAQTQGAELASETERYMYDTSRADYAPYREVGQGALYQLADLYGVPRPLPSATPTPTPTSGAQGTQNIPSGFGGLFGRGGTWNPNGTSGGTGTPTPTPTQYTSAGSFTASPSYQFRLDEGMKAIERSAAARGGLRSAATMDAMNRRAQDYASLEFENYANRLASLAGVGQTSTANLAALGSQTASNIANTQMAAGNARASAYQNTGSAINNTVGGLASAYLYNKGYGG